ncbi:SID1 transmembrane family member 1-like isoform X1 [Diorhabda sublineata]|uniref:SID1 transmembrane family member 1-like isoform X1 n=1 Tax=Diorhabda sublineata TaxID=1163346 RepID=UPI0024E112FB|nr:SID1 transmembrane family member 1-like isoform X1 [Diorhabda sublineata]
MYKVIFLFLSLCLAVSESVQHNPAEYVILKYNETYTNTINNNKEYLLEVTETINDTVNANPPRIWIQSNATVSFPLMIVARQTKEMISWQLPLEIEGDVGEFVYNYTTKTMCHDILKHYRMNGRHQKMIQENSFISIATSSNKTINFTIEVRKQNTFTIELSKEHKFNITPSQPSYFFYNFTTDDSLIKKGDSNYETVILEVNSDDDICMVVSIQNISCPVFDTNQDVTFRGFYETVNRKGGITIPKYKFPQGFYIVFVAKPDDYACEKSGFSNVNNSERVKQISLVIKPSITYSDYVMAVLITLGCIGGFYIIFGLPYFFYTVKATTPRAMEYVDNFSTTPNARIVRLKVTRTFDGTEMANVQRTISTMSGPSVDITDYDTLNEVDIDKNLRLGRGQPFLIDLARKPPKELTKRSYLYLYNVLTVAIFYALPVLQLVVTYQMVLNETGQQDLCYYNFLCAHPLGFLSDFNHVFSNIGYVLLGVLFLIITYLREQSHKDADFDKEFGIPQHYGMFYAMGVALIMEGILSGSYHVCPNSLNFQFDSSFMYVMAVLCMVKLYQNRHPDINANAYTTFGVLALAVVLAMIGILEANQYFWITFVIIHILMCFYLSVKVYYMGCWRLRDLSLQKFKQVWIYDFWSGPTNVVRPCHKARFVLLFLGNLCNWGLDAFALYRLPKNFPVFLLTIFMTNTMLYFVFYIVMKYINKEKVRLLTWAFLIVSGVCAISAMYFFLHKAISWKRTAAQSRQFNVECKLFRFYDYHDIWHFLSAIGMFFTFMVLLTLDDDLSHTHHSQIPVF